MKLLILIIGIAIGAVAVWYFGSSSEDASLERAGDKLESSARAAGDTIQQKLGSLNLSGEEIREELNRTGRVIRQNANQAGQAISDATTDARTTAAIKANLLRDPELSAWDISVNTTAGTVTLSGAVSNPDQIGRAMLLAMESDGVKQVISTLQVKPTE